MTVTRHPLFFEVTINGRRNYILGTCHTLPTLVLPQAASEIIDSCSRLYCETGITSYDLSTNEFIKSLQQRDLSIDRIPLIDFISTRFPIPAAKAILKRIYDLLNIIDFPINLNCISPNKAMKILKFIGMDSTLKRAFRRQHRSIYALDTIEIDHALECHELCDCSPFCKPDFSRRYLEDDVINIFMEESCLHDKIGVFNQFRNNIWIKEIDKNIKTYSLSIYAFGAAHVFGIISALMRQGAMIRRMKTDGSLYNVTQEYICREPLQYYFRISSTLTSIYLRTNSALDSEKQVTKHRAVKNL